MVDEHRVLVFANELLRSMERFSDFDIYRTMEKRHVYECDDKRKCGLHCVMFDGRLAWKMERAGNVINYYSCVVY